MGRVARWHASPVQQVAPHRQSHQVSKGARPVDSNAILCLRVRYYRRSRPSEASLCYSAMLWSLCVCAVACPYGLGNCYTTRTGKVTIPSTYASSCLLEFVITTGAPIFLRFESFATEADYDFVEVYDGTSTTGMKKGQFSGTIIPDVQGATSGSMFVRFVSDADQGKAATQTSLGVTMTWFDTSPYTRWPTSVLEPSLPSVGPSVPRSLLPSRLPTLAPSAPWPTPTPWPRVTAAPTTMARPPMPTTRLPTAGTASMQNRPV